MSTMMGDSGEDNKQGPRRVLAKEKILENQLKRVEIDLAEARAKYHELLSNLEKNAFKQLDQRESELKRLSDENKRLKKENQKHKQASTQTSTQKVSIEEFELQKKRILELEQALQKAKSVIVIEKGHFVELENAIKQLKKVNQKINNDNIGLLARMRTIEEQALISKLKTGEERGREKSQYEKDLQLEREKLEKALDKANRELTDKEEQLNDLAKTIEEEEALIETLRLKIEQERNAYLHKMQILEQQLKLLQAQLAEKNKGTSLKIKGGVPQSKNTFKNPTLLITSKGAVDEEIAYSEKTKKTSSTPSFDKDFINRRAQKIGKKSTKLRDFPDPLLEDLGWEDLIYGVKGVKTKFEKESQLNPTASPIPKPLSQYTQIERQQHHQDKVSLYRDWKIQHESNHNFYELQKKKEDGYETAVVVSRNLVNKTMEIASSQATPHDEGILLMLEQAREISMRIPNPMITISYCEKAPEIALRMKELGEKMGLMHLLKFDEETDIAIKQFQLKPS